MTREEGIQKALDDTKAAGVVEGLPVAGYKPQSLEAVAMVNKNKQLEETLLRVCDSMRTKHRDEYSPFDQRWVSIAVTHFEQGFMALNRAVFQPERIKLPGDDSGKIERPPG